jgi:hypothetical protein
MSCGVMSRRGYSFYIRARVLTSVLPISNNSAVLISISCRVSVLSYDSSHPVQFLL